MMTDIDFKSSHSETEAFRMCERRHFYGYGLRIRGKRTSVALARGSLGHEVLAAYYGNCREGGNFREAKSIAYGHLATRLTELEEDYPSDKLREDLTFCFKDYFKLAEREFDRIEVVAVEESFSVRINEFFTLPFIVDVILRYDGILEAWDHKFVWDFFNPNVVDLSPQLPLYYAGLSMLGYPPVRVRYNEIRYRATKEITADPTKRINRPAPRVSPTRVLTTMEEHIRIGQRIFDLKQLGLEEWENQIVRAGNNQVCRNCDFSKLCIAELNGEDRNQFYIGVDYIERSR
jgi:hypothetical protein